MSTEFLLFNPCKHCLTRGACQKTCNDLSSHIDTVGLSFFIALLSMTISLVVIISVWIWDQYILNFSLHYLVIAFYIIIYTISFMQMIRNYEEYEKAKWFTIIGVALIAPFGMTIITFFESSASEVLVDKFCHRYIKKVWYNMHPKEAS